MKDYIVGITVDPRSGRPNQLADFNTEREAAEFISTLPDHLDGRYYIDGPETRDPERRPADDPDSRRFILRIDAWTEGAELEAWQVEGLLSAGMTTFGLDARDFIVEVEWVLA